MNGARILLGVCGGIAAYKAAALTSRLVQRGHVLDVILTDEAQRFIAPLTFAALTRRTVYTSLWENGAAIPHIVLARENGAYRRLFESQALGRVGVAREMAAVWTSPLPRIKAVGWGSPSWPMCFHMAPSMETSTFETWGLRLSRKSMRSLA